LFENNHDQYGKILLLLKFTIRFLIIFCPAVGVFPGNVSKLLCCVCG